MYAQDSDETYPSVVFANYPQGLWGSPTWNNYGWAYLWPLIYPYTKNIQLFTCPSANPQWVGPSNDPNNPAINLSYAYSEYIYDNGRGWSKMASLASSNFGVAKVAMIGDSRFAGIANDWDDGGTNNATYPDNFLARFLLANGSTPRHDGTSFMYSDGHAKFAPTNTIRCPQPGGTAGEYPIINPGAASEL
jgi:hypothetical protein